MIALAVVLEGLLACWLVILTTMLWGPQEPYAKRAVCSLSDTDDALQRGLIRTVAAHNATVRHLAEELGLEVDPWGPEVIGFPGHSIRALTFKTQQSPPKLVRSKK